MTRIKQIAKDMKEERTNVGYWRWLLRSPTIPIIWTGTCYSHRMPVMRWLCSGSQDQILRRKGGKEHGAKGQVPSPIP